MAEDLLDSCLIQDLPLSQEHYSDIWNRIHFSDPLIDVESQNLDIGDVEIKPNILSLPFEATIPDDVDSITPIGSSSKNAFYFPSALPAKQSWPGGYDFKVSFGPQEKATKGVSWTYSKQNDKLYVNKDVACPINFSVNQSLPEGVKIRAQAQFSSPEYASEAVTRCISHCHEDSQKGISEANHIIRCESRMAYYETDLATKHNSVLVPFENPAAGQDFSTYIFKFTCFGSCNGGPNRRPLMLILTLEESGIVVGRHKLDIKICACPGRDRNAEEKVSKEPKQSGSNGKRKHAQAFKTIGETLDFTTTNFPATKKRNVNERGRFSVETKDQGMYDFLIQMKKLYKFHKGFEKLSDDTKKALLKSFNKKDGEDSDSA